MVTRPEAAAGAHLVRNLVLFGRLLRGLGLDVNPGRVIDLVEALPLVEIGRRSDFFFAARSLLVHRREDLALFEAAFEMFWQRPVDEWTRIELPGLLRRSPPRPVVVPPTLDQAAAPPVPDGPDDDDAEIQIIEATRTYSSREVLRHRDFAELTETELRAVKDLIDGLLWALGRRRTRRYRPGRGHRLDLRRTLRRSLRHGGEPLDWARRLRREKPRPLVVLADISGSMERYIRLLLHFIYSLTQGLSQRVEAFAFGTRLSHLSRHMRDRDVERALAGVSEDVSDWSGGTRIGEALQRFNYDWARRVLGNGAVVLLISDGWDRGEPELLAAEMARLSRSCYRLIWLNPLLGSPEYEPLTRGMQAALPYVDDFLPVHNLASLEALAALLSRLDRRRPPGNARRVG